MEEKKKIDISSTLLLFTVWLLQPVTYSCLLCEQTRGKKKNSPLVSCRQPFTAGTLIKTVVLKLPSAKQQAAKAMEWQINTVKHRAEEIYFPQALLEIKEGSRDSGVTAVNAVKILNIVLRLPTRWQVK